MEETFYFKSIQKKKKKKSLVSRKEGEGREKKRSRVKHETLLRECYGTKAQSNMNI